MTDARVERVTSATVPLLGALWIFQSRAY